MVNFKQLQDHLDNGEVEYVMCVANWICDGKHYKYKPFNIDKGCVISGWSRMQIYELSEFQFPKWLYQSKIIEGVLTNKNRFLKKSEVLELIESNKLLTIISLEEI